MRYSWLYVSLCFLLASCQFPKVEVPVSFYYWKTQYLSDSIASDALKVLSTDHLYIRYMDVGIVAEEIVPISPIQFVEDMDTNIHSVTPVIYIKNEVFLAASVNVDTLAHQIWQYVKHINLKSKIEINDLQIDCDWSKHSRAQYFSFLQKLKTLTQLPITATIRLHQVKFPTQTGIPPVDKGILMYYNMNPIKAGGKNSIYDESTANSYVKYLANYPLRLDIALPIFSWVVLERNGKLKKLLRKVDIQSLAENPALQSKDSERYQVLSPTIIDYEYLEQGDVLRMESVSKEDVEKMKKNIGKYLKYTPDNIIYYDLDGLNFKNMNYDKKSVKKMGNWY